MAQRQSKGVAQSAALQAYTGFKGIVPAAVGGASDGVRVLVTDANGTAEWSGQLSEEHHILTHDGSGVSVGYNAGMVLHQYEDTNSSSSYTVATDHDSFSIVDPPGDVLIHVTSLVRNSVGGGQTILYIFDGAGGTGTRWGSAFTECDTAEQNYPVAFHTRVVPQWAGSKTFYLRIDGANTFRILGTASGANTFVTAVLA